MVEIVVTYLFIYEKNRSEIVPKSYLIVLTAILIYEVILVYLY